MPRVLNALNIEKYLIEKISQDTEYTAYAEVPENRPSSFVTVERTGGNRGSVATDSPMVAIQSWSTSRISASEMAYEIDKYIYDMVLSDGNIANVSRSSLYNFTDTSGQARYQGIYTFLTN